MFKTNVKVFAITGGVTYGAAKYVFDVSTMKAILAGIVVGAIGVALISISFPVQNSTIPTQ